MPRHLKYFEWLIYGAIAVQGVETLLSQKSWTDFVAFAVIAILIAVLALAAARGYRSAAWILVIFFLFDAANTIGSLWGQGPTWLQGVLAPEQPATSLMKVMDSITNFMEAAALYFYFFDANRPPSLPSS